MEKNIIGDWGAELPDMEYGRALAALGVLEASGTHQVQASDDPQKLAIALSSEFEDGERTVVWRNALDIKSTTPALWRKTIHTNAQALAKAWELLLRVDQPRRKPRLAIRAGWRHRPDLFDFEALFGWLGRPQNGCQSLIVAPEARPAEFPCRVSWHWPLRIGLPSGPEAESLYAAIRDLGVDWVDELTRPILVGEGRDKCDLLILPAGMAAELAAQPRLRLQASFVACLDDPVPWCEAPDTPHAALRDKMDAAGIALAGHSDHSGFTKWYCELVRALSHDQPVHGALWDISAWTGAVPTIIGLPSGLDRLRILAVAERVDRKLKSVLGPREEPDFSFGLPGFEVPDATLAGRVRSRSMDSEGEDGVPIAREMAKREAEFDERRQPRFLQARAWREDSAVPARKLAPERPSLLTIHIGPSAERRTDTPFPDRELDYAAGPVGVTVQVELVGAAATSLRKDPQLETLIQSGGPPAAVARHLVHVLDAPGPAGGAAPFIGLAGQDISLPEAGDSDLAYFAVWPQSGMAEVAGRIAVIHHGRIIQTARLVAPVGAESAAGPGLTVEAEDLVHPRTDDLDERRDFDAALIAADDLGGQLRLTINRNGRVYKVLLNNLQEAIIGIRSAIFEAAHRPGDTLALNDDLMHLVLGSLASQGRLLFDELHAHLGDMLNSFDRIQLLSRGTAFFPLEYVYSGPPPEEDAQVCPGAVHALENGGCGDCENQKSEEYLCPLHFWGFRKIIERHAASGDNGELGQSGTADRRRLPSPTRTPFGEVHPVLFAASQKAFDFDDGAAWRAKLMGALSRLGNGSPPGEAQTWDVWRELVANTQPNPKVLVLLPHSDTIPIARPILEIGSQKRLLKHQIKADLIGEDEIPQLLLLLGCSAAAVTEDFAPYPQSFRRAGADIVIAPLAPILGADAAPIAERISELLADRLAQQREVAFGELLRDIRCELLAKGHPGVLGLVGFGDADWLFGG